jgi:cyclophilin family peptidyl-prolyl cis-trans isomerase/HEAT repeat protein
MNRRSCSWLTLAALATAACATAPPPPAPVVVTYEQKLSWILRLEDQRVLRDPPPAPAPVPPASGRGRAPVVAPAAVPIPDLTVLLTDSDARLRRRAALAVGRVGLAEGAAPLVGLLEDSDADVRQMACFALGLLRAPQAFEGLLAALDDVDLRVQGRAAEALGMMADPRAADAVGRLVARHAGDPAVTGLAPDEMREDLPPAADAFRLGLYALVRLEAWEPVAGAVLGPDGTPRVAWWPVAYAVQRLGDRRAVPALLALARSPHTDVLGFAARGLGVLKAAEGVPALVPLLDPATRDLRVVASAARALGQIGRPEATDALLRLVRHPRADTGTRVEAVTALGLLKARGAMDDLLDLVGHREPAVRGAALVAVAAIDLDTFITMMSGLDPDPAWQVRVDLARALGSLPRERARPLLAGLVRDVDQRVVAAALRALAAVDAPDLPALLRASLEHDDVTLRATAAALVGERRPAGGDAWAREAWIRGRSDASYVARAAALAAVAAYGVTAARPVLEEGLTDPDWAVRVRAAQLLKAADPLADVTRMRPAPVRRNPADYAATGLVTPPYSTQVYVDTTRGTVQLELFVLDAPLTTINFVELARRGFFDGNPIHRVVPNFVVQDGDPRGDGEGGPGYTIRDEINMRPYLRGSVGMALDWADTGGSQFFITHGPQPHLDGRYTVFGRVTAGLEVVDALQRWDVITKVRVWDGVAPPDPSGRAGARPGQQQKRGH